ncbi:MAG TPA: UDP-glucose/GDP-mannose dehydrogenase family protein [Bacillales bacterium]|nr:UDP-glucose/GDP-mannose dehydrogenase family protein [Bacillales bacterium]
MNVCIIGAGYVGLTTGVILSEFGHDVCCADIDLNKIKRLKAQEVPFYEPGLEEKLKRQVSSGHLRFSTDVEECIKGNDIVMIAVGTPPETGGRPNLKAFDEVVRTLARSIASYKLIIIKSTVPPGTNENTKFALINAGVKGEWFDVVSNPEFLREGSAVEDTLHPHKIVVGTSDPKTVGKVRQLYKNGEAPYIVTTPESAELIKYASNAFLATKLSFINEIARICEAYHADIDDIAEGLAADPRIGPHFLKAGLGFGGSCLPKDLTALEYAALRKQVVPSLLHAVKTVNDTQIDVYEKKLQQWLADAQNKQVTVWGLTFKANTDDVRHSPAHALIERLLQKQFTIHTYDPMAVSSELDCTRYDNRYQALDGSDALVVATDWPEFRETDWREVKRRLRGTVVLDARNGLNAADVRDSGLVYAGVGKR